MGKRNKIEKEESTSSVRLPGRRPQAREEDTSRRGGRSRFWERKLKFNFSGNLELEYGNCNPLSVLLELQGLGFTRGSSFLFPLFSIFHFSFFFFLLASVAAEWLATNTSPKVQKGKFFFFLHKKEKMKKKSLSPPPPNIPKNFFQNL